jgi:outer membrane protein assembly factor BamB
MSWTERLRSYAATHGVRYTLRRLSEKVGQVVFGTWANRLYSLDTRTGALQWTWKCAKPSRMYSPAATWPVKSAGKIFISVPDRCLYVLDARTG